MSDEIDQKKKVGQNTRFFLEFFPQLIGDHGTSVSYEIDQKKKVGQNTRFFLRIFSPAHFDHWKLR